MSRCPWAISDFAIPYHDREWGVPAHDDRVLFEFLILEGAQAGLSWETILKKRETYRAAFDQFDPDVVAKYAARKVEKLLADPGIVRNRLKVASAVQNARCFLEVQKEFGTFDTFIWDLAGGAPVDNRLTSARQVPASTPVSDAMSRELRRRGFKFVGTTIMYAYMQATGMVNDHLVSCFRHDEVGKARARKKR
ncbi:MAG TPA: DNA-3-methyladenine glycosylase I [Thermoanaerobaculia bacterium]|nr:DNA-3-methyladenine glycosylase I [Thermoanaerobaculia bacterium]